MFNSTSNQAQNGSRGAKNSAVLQANVSHFQSQNRNKNKLNSNPIGPREPNQIKAIQKSNKDDQQDMPEDDGPDEMETMTQNDDDMIDHQLLKRVGDNLSNGSNDKRVS